MRKSVIDDILSSFYYRNEEGMPLYSVTSNFLLIPEVEFLVKECGFEVKQLNPSYFFVMFKQNLKHEVS